MMMKQNRASLLNLMQASVAGSLVFWLSFVLSSLFDHQWGISAIIMLTVSVPVLMCLAVELLSDLRQISRGLIAASMLAGVWISGPLWITVENTLTPGQGFHMAGAWTALAWETLLFPFATFMMATYHGSLGALLLSLPVVAGLSMTNFRFLDLRRHPSN